MESEGVPTEAKAQNPAMTRRRQYTHKTLRVSIWQEIQTILTTENHCQLLKFIPSFAIIIAKNALFFWIVCCISKAQQKAITSILLFSCS